ncbi:MAG: ABC transporter ATP-binding protein [Chloroflexota bacterium]
MIAGSALIRVHDVTRTFGSTVALDHVSLDIGEGEFVAVVGPSGSGKTTLLRIIADLAAPSSGTVSVAGQPPATARRNRMFGVVFQRSAALPWQSALKDVRFTLSIAKPEHGLDPEALLDRFGLAQALEKYPHQLSGGMLQRLNLAAALVHDPPILLMDEPFAALDEMRREEIGEWLLQSALAGGRKTVLLITHSVDEAVYLADRVVAFSSAPARVVADVSVPLPRPRPPQAAARAMDEFVHTARDVRLALAGLAKEPA